MASQNGGPLAGFRNQLINGDFRIWQRGTSVIHGAADGGYTADRWVTSANTTTSQRSKHGGVPVAEVLGSSYFLQGVELYVDPFSNTVSAPMLQGLLGRFLITQQKHPMVQYQTSLNIAI